MDIGYAEFREQPYESTKKRKAKEKLTKHQKGPPGPPKLSFPPFVTFSPRSEGQVVFQRALDKSRLVLYTGPAGSGKTLLPVSKAMDLLAAGTVNRIIISRPAVEAGEKLGFLPGGIQEKVDPYMQPIYDAIHDKLGGESKLTSATIQAWMKAGILQIVPLAFMRGRTFKNCAVIVDEAQNASYMQIKMALTRIGTGSVMYVGGDVTQCDLPTAVPVGLIQVLERFEQSGKYPVVHLSESDIQRDPVVADVLDILK